MPDDEPPQADAAPAPPPRHRPLLPVLAGMAAGIALDGALAPPLWFWAALALGILVPALAALRRDLRPWGRWALALMLVIPVGGGWHAIRMRALPPWHLARLSLAPDGLYYARGVVTAGPQMHYRRGVCPAEAEEPFAFWSLRVRLDGISGDGVSWQRATGGLTVFVSEGRPGVGAGDRVQWLGPIEKNRPPSNPGERDSALAFARQDSYGTSSVAQGSAIRLLEPVRWPPSPRVALARLAATLEDRTRAALRPARADVAWGVLSALLFGERGALTHEQTSLMAESGTLHFLAISGLNVGIFCLFVAAVAALVGLPVRAREIVSIVLIWCYVLFTGAQVSVLRAGLTLSFLLAAPLLERRRDGLSAAMAAALVLLIVWPQQLFAPGFQLTFVAVWAIVCIYPQLHGILWPWEDFVARVQAPGERSLWTDLARAARSLLMLSLTVWAATAPIIAYHFHLVSPLAPLLNLIVWPLVLAPQLLGLVLLAAVALGLPGVGLLGAAALGLTSSVGYLLAAASRLPGFGIYVPAPPLWWIALFYGTAGLWVVRARVRWGRQAVAALILVLAGAYAAQDAAARAGREFRVVVADVGHGQCAIFEMPTGQCILVDAGSMAVGRADAVSDVLWTDHVRWLDGVLVSDVNTDHAGFLPDLTRRFEVGRVVAPFGARGRPGAPPGSQDDLTRCVRDILERRRVPFEALGEGTRLEAGGLSCQILHPDARFSTMPSLPSNERSLVVRCAYGGLSLLCPGDAEHLAIQRLVAERCPALRADVLLMPHHGRYYEGLAAFLDCVSPQAAIVSGPMEECDPRMLALLGERGVPVWITGRDGAVVIRFGGGEVELRGHLSGRCLRLRPSG